MQLKCVLKRLKKPSVIISIVSQIITLLVIFDINIDKNEIVKGLSLVCSILITLGIVSNPDTIKRGYLDDIAYCEKCLCKSKHILIDGDMRCELCGKINKNMSIKC